MEMKICPVCKRKKAKRTLASKLLEPIMDKQYECSCGAKYAEKKLIKEQTVQEIVAMLKEERGNYTGNTPEKNEAYNALSAFGERLEIKYYQHLREFRENAKPLVENMNMRELAKLRDNLNMAVKELSEGDSITLSGRDKEPVLHINIVS